MLIELMRLEDGTHITCPHWSDIGVLMLVDEWEWCVVPSGVKA